MLSYVFGCCHAKSKFEFGMLGHPVSAFKYTTASHCEFSLGDHSQQPFWTILKRAAHFCLFLRQFCDFGVDDGKRMPADEFFVTKIKSKMVAEVVNGSG